GSFDCPGEVVVNDWNAPVPFGSLPLDTSVFCEPYVSVSSVIVPEPSGAYKPISPLDCDNLKFACSGPSPVSWSAHTSKNPNAGIVVAAALFVGNCHFLGVPKAFVKYRPPTFTDTELLLKISIQSSWSPASSIAPFELSARYSLIFKL